MEGIGDNIDVMIISAALSPFIGRGRSKKRVFKRGEGCDNDDVQIVVASLVVDEGGSW